MLNGYDIDEILGIIDSIEHAVVSHTDPPEDRCSLLAERAKTMRYSSMSSASVAGRDPPLYLLKGFSWLGRALSRQCSVVDVFPKLGVRLEVDDDVGFLAVRVDDESHAFHTPLLVFCCDCIMKPIACFERQSSRHMGQLAQG
jgi:hypothetical protein